METRSAKKRKLLISIETNQSSNYNFNGGIDRISELPNAILHNILFLLPIRTVAQASILSKRWRSLWSTFPDLDFTKCNPYPFKNPNLNYNPSRKSHSTPAKNTDFITQVLTLRDKNSDIRALRFCAPLSFSGLNGLMRLAIRHKVQELDVEVSTEDYFNFPRCVIASDSLRVLKLKSRYPGFRLPPSYVMKDGFRFLQSLSLSVIIFHHQTSLSDLFSDSSFPHLKKLSLDTCFGLKFLHVGCNALEDLTLEKCDYLQGLDISGPKLERMRVASCFLHVNFVVNSWLKIDAPRLRKVLWECNGVTDSCTFVNLSSLQEVLIGSFLIHNEDTSVDKLQSISSFLSGLSHAHSLTLRSQCVEMLSNYNYFSVYLDTFYNLKYLELHTIFNKNNLHGLACIFRNSPSLETLVLNIIDVCKNERRQWNRDLWDVSSSSEEEFYWESQTESLKSFLSNVKIVKIRGFVECENEVILAKFLLKHGKALEEMNLSTHPNARDSLRRQKIRSQIMGFSWPSSNAKITFHSIN